MHTPVGVPPRPGGQGDLRYRIFPFLKKCLSYYYYYYLPTYLLLLLPLLLLLLVLIRLLLLLLHLRRLLLVRFRTIIVHSAPATHYYHTSHSQDNRGGTICVARPCAHMFLV